MTEAKVRQLDDGYYLPLVLKDGEWVDPEPNEPSYEDERDAMAESMRINSALLRAEGGAG